MIHMCLISHTLTGSSGQAAQRNVWQTAWNDATLGDRVPAKDRGYCI